MKKSRFSEEQIIGMRKEADKRYEGRGPVPQARHIGRDVLYIRTVLDSKLMF
ncbi:hypothetical protein PHO31112_02220 [Pandoraea horticolens]|uniref:Uncharacterized protein n=1 Tax=Pandoraea horticolens TaxID=2508298 RepID=A0A5E4US38_9BURK|nr:hypothetical protein PHO31112_02220 [Pandoraea horticolens]